MAHLFKVPIHTVKPVADPANPGLEERYLQFGELGQHPAADNV